MVETRTNGHDPAVIVDRGYRHYEGRRTGRRGAVRAIVREGFRRVLGLRRKAKHKLFPWILISIALAAVVMLVTVTWVSSTAGNPAGADDQIPSYGGFFDFVSVVALVFAGYAGPQLLIPDRTRGVLNVYFSRPLTVQDYLLAKGGAYAAVILSFWLAPQLLLHLGYAALSSEGFLSYLGQTTDILWKVPLAALAYFTLHASLIFLISSFVNRVGGAAAAFLGGLFGLNLIALLFNEATSAPGARWTALLAFEQHPRYIRDWIFGFESSLIPAQAGFGPGASLTVVIGLAAACAALIVWRYRRLT